MIIKEVPDRQTYKRMSTDELRDSYLVTQLFKEGEIQLHSVDVDRAVIGSAVPTNNRLALEAPEELAAEYFTERREIGVVNIGGAGKIEVDGQVFEVVNRDSLYVGRSSKEIHFESADAAQPAHFYLQSYPAHHSFPSQKVTQEEANKVELGSTHEANKRTIFQSICPGRVETCQIVMGFTELAEGCIWNTMPPHTHRRRSEVYLYFDLQNDARVLHFMGEPTNTRSLVMNDREAVISPSWSIHCGAGTSDYSFIWCMGGENQEFTDMAGVALKELK